MRLSNKSSVIEERQRDWVAHQKQCYRINQSEVSIWLINCKINCYISTSTLYCFLYTIRSSFYSSARHTSSIIARALLSIYLLGNLLQKLHESHLHYSSRYLTKTYAFVRQIDAFSFASFKRLLNSFDFDFVSSL